VVLAGTLVAYALAMTAGHGHFGSANLGLLLAAGLGLSLFVFIEARAASPLIGLAAFGNPVFSASLAVNVAVATVVSATLAVGPFYLFHGLGLEPASVGLVVSVGPIISAISGILAGRLVDHWGATRIVFAGLVIMALGAFGLSALPDHFGVVGYIAPIAVIAPGYQLFQAANNTAVMMDVKHIERGTISGMLNLSRNLGLITGASLMGAIFALASGTTGTNIAGRAAITTGLQVTFALSCGLMFAAVAVVALARRFPSR
jgi:MFS family permease